VPASRALNAAGRISGGREEDHQIEIPREESTSTNYGGKTIQLKKAYTSRRYRRHRRNSDSRL